MGQMNISDFKQQLDPNRPALIVISVGTTFKGAIDDQEAINAVVREAGIPAVYRHLDAALFGSLLAFVEDEEARSIVNATTRNFDSIAISGHKFWGFDEPCGIFLTTAKVRSQLNPFYVPYLKDNVPTISCSRSALSPLKFWFKLHTTPPRGFQIMAELCLQKAKYLFEHLLQAGIRAWRNPYSNIVFFQRPSKRIMDKYILAQDYQEELGELGHLVVMQHVTMEILDEFVREFDQK